MPSKPDVNPAPVHRLVGRMRDFLGTIDTSCNLDGELLCRETFYCEANYCMGCRAALLLAELDSVYPPNVNDQRAAKEAGHGK
jgi:hypothetical protein